MGGTQPATITSSSCQGCKIKLMVPFTAGAPEEAALSFWFTACQCTGEGLFVPPALPGPSAAAAATLAVAQEPSTPVKSAA